MKLTLRREPSRLGATLGVLYVDGVFECHTLEDPVRTGPKIPGQTAIPAGTYTVTVNYSPRFQCLMPEICDVPGFTGIRIHSGNTADDTEGCILVGQERTPPASIIKSRLAYQALYPRLFSAASRGGITLTIVPAET